MEYDCPCPAPGPIPGPGPAPMGTPCAATARAKPGSAKKPIEPARPIEPIKPTKPIEPNRRDMALPMTFMPASLLEQIVQRRLRPRQLRPILRYVSSRLRLEVITEIRLILLAHLLRRGLLAMLRIRRVVLNAHLAHVQLRITRLANIEPSQRQAEGGERRSAAPTD